MKSLKEGLFRIANGQNGNTDNEPSATPDASSSPTLTRQFEDEGFTQAANMQGSKEGLAICLNRLYQEYKAEVKNDKATQEKSRKPIREEIEEHNGKINQLQKRIEAIQDDKLPRIKQRIEELNDEVRDIRQHPEKVIGESPGKASFLIGVAILVCLSVYLFIFYSSASYSAFFKQFTPEEMGVANSIFDAQALPKAYNHGVTELILILMMPFVFLGLGFLVHKFQQSKEKGRLYKIGILVLVTFLFDGILAFEITEKIYRLEALQAFSEVPEYTITMAAEDPKFWLIIFAGFVVYLIWGFVFDFVIDEHERLDAVSMAIKMRLDRVEDAKAEKRELQEETSSLRERIAKHKTEVTKRKHTLDVTIFIPKEFQRRITAFMVGWVHWMKANKHADSAVREAKLISDRFLDNVMSNTESDVQTELA